MENYGLQTCIFLFCHSFFVSFSSFSFVNYELKIGFKAQFLKFQVFDISSAKQKSFFDQSTIKRLGKLKLLGYYELKPLLLGLISNSKLLILVHCLFAWKLYIPTNHHSM